MKVTDFQRALAYILAMNEKWVYVPPDKRTGLYVDLGEWDLPDHFDLRDRDETN